MSFHVPTFNLLCDLWSFGAAPPAPARLVGVACNLAYGRRIHGDYYSVPGGMGLLLPAGTDVRSGVQGGGSDWVEVPQGTGRFYRVVDVDDSGKGFSNEFRVAALVQTVSLGAWPTPMP